MISERVNNILPTRTSSAKERNIPSNHKNHLHLQGYKSPVKETYLILLPQIEINR